MDKEQIINDLFGLSQSIRYVAIYAENVLHTKERIQTANSSSVDTDRYEELLVNPTLLTLARQRGNIDCGGLDHIIIGYGNFHQLVKEIPGGHLSICLEKDADLNKLPQQIIKFIKGRHPQIFES